MEQAVFRTEAIKPVVSIYRNFDEVFSALDEIEYRIIEDIDDLEDVYRLRYRAYRAKGYMDPRDDGKCFDDLDEVKNVRIFGVYFQEVLVASIRVHVLNQNNLLSPSMLVYGDTLIKKIEQGNTFIDSTRFTLDPEFELGVKMLHFLTMRIPILGCEYHKADYSLSLVRPTHGAFYRRYFGSKLWGKDRVFPGLTFPVDLYSGAVAPMRDVVLKRLPFLNSLPVEQRILFDEDFGRHCCNCARSTARLAVNIANGNDNRPMPLVGLPHSA